jgi:hypothetical protein
MVGSAALHRRCAEAVVHCAGFWTRPRSEARIGPAGGFSSSHLASFHLASSHLASSHLAVLGRPVGFSVLTRAHHRTRSLFHTHARTLAHARARAHTCGRPHGRTRACGTGQLCRAMEAVVAERSLQRALARRHTHGATVACERLQTAVQHAAGNRQHTPCNVHHTICKIQHTTYNMYRATCNIQHATYNMQQAAYTVQHATCGVQHAAYNIEHATCDVQHALRKRSWVGVQASDRARRGDGYAQTALTNPRHSYP